MIPKTRPQSRKLFSANGGIRRALGPTAALTLVLGLTSAVAQEKKEEPVVLEKFVVNGVRASLISAQEIKQNSVQLVDSIVAEDIGKLPDNTVADALQRVPGIQVGRNIGEVNTVVIRGLPNLGTTLNGNEIFTGTGRGLALQDIPAELVAGVDVYKSTSPDKVEGGIAGLIDIRLRKPLDFDKPQLAGSARLIHGEDAEKNGYIASVLLSNRWKTSAGDLGILYSAAYQRRYSVDQIAFNFLFEPQSVPNSISPSGTLELPFTQGGQVIPADRTRTAQNLSLQLKVNSEWEFYDDFLKTTYDDKHQVHFLIGFPRFGTYQSAKINSGNVPFQTVSTGNFHLTSMQAFIQDTDGYQNVLGTKWTRDDFKLVAEYLYNWNRFRNQALIVDTRYAALSSDTFTFTYNDGGKANLTIPGTGITDTANYFLWGLFDNHDTSVSEQNGLKVELEKSLKEGVFQKISGGIRWSDRDVRFRGTSRNDIAPAGATGGDRFAATVPRISTIAGFGAVNPDGPLSYYGTQHWIDADPAYLYSHGDQVRTLFGLPAGPAPYNPTLGFTDDESVLAGFFNATFASMVDNKAFDGSIGVRVARTKQDLTGYNSTGMPIDGSKSQTDILPVLNSRLKLTDQWQLRFAAGRTITRPNFNDLNPAVTLNAPTTTGGAGGTGSGGNPDLDTVQSDNYDLSLEYYFAKDGHVSATLFHRDIEGYVQSFAASETIGGTTYTVVRPRNSGKGKLDGFEVSYQHFPEALRGLGWMANYTYIDGDTDAADARPGAAVGARIRQPYAQVAKQNYNVILVYEKGKFSSRLAYNRRGEFTDTFNGPNAAGSPLRQIIVKPRGTLDFSASYAINDHFTVSLDATNLTKTNYQDYFYRADLYPRDTRAYDRTIEVGVRYRY
ncbi:MAG TPA: TonB-dependent receptor [Lacunisphaera sp.]|nr:TonB-dependent receptor [Lacunisphaera sp.]